MSALRDEIRAILRQEIAALREPMQGPRVETVRIASGADLTRFAQDIARRCTEPGFADQLAQGEVRFELAQSNFTASTPIVCSTPRPASNVLEKSLITERDIAGLGPQTRSLAIAKHSRLTPLARDEARRRGIRIERTDT